MNYPNMHRDYGWALGVHRGPIGYQHPWIVVLEHVTLGFSTRRDASDLYALLKGAGQEAQETYQ